VSNTGTFTVTVMPDTLLDLGTIIGKVFEDRNGDGLQNPDEPGVAGVMVALDNGTYALTDPYGRYHFPAVVSGHRMVKINLQSVPGLAAATTDESVILSITPALLAKANFGIRYSHMTEKIGRPGQLGVLVQAEADDAPIRVLGDAESMTILVNDMMAALPQSDLQLRTESIEDVVEYSGNRLNGPVAFTAHVDSAKAISTWQLLIRDRDDKVVRTLKGTGKPPSEISWNGLDAAGKPLRAGAVYQYQLEVSFSDGTQSRSARRLVGINRATAVSLNLSGGAFESGSDQLTTRAITLLRETADVIRQYPNEKIVIEGHTDWEGTEDYNIDLSKRRALAARNYLVNVEKLPADQFVLRWYGESRPIANNESSEGREINRRVEISSKLTKVEKAKVHDQYRDGKALVQVDEARPILKEGSRFSTELMVGEKDYVDIEVFDSKGGYAQGAVPLPDLEILQLPKELKLPLGTRTYRYRVHTPKTASTSSADDVVISYRLVGRTTPGNTVELDAQSLHVDDKGFFVAANLRMDVSGNDGTKPVVVTDPIPNLAVQLPPAGVPITSEVLAIPGQTDPGNQISVNGEAVEVQSDGKFVAHVKLPIGETRLLIKVTDPEGHSGTIERVITRKSGLFLLAFGDAKFSKLKGSGFIQGAGMEKESETLTEGRVAYYLKGTIAGKYLITSAFDSGRNEFDKLFDDLDEQQNDRLLTNLDPDKFYPVYGDSSTIVYDAESQSKFFLAIDSKEMHALVGNYPLRLTDTELATYQRTLYGAHFAYKSLAETKYKQPKTKAEVFAAEVRQANVTDELRATGGSLYFLSQREVIEGSEQVVIVVRDKDTGLELSRVPQQQNVDYTVKYDEGRIIFNRPIASVQADDRLVNEDLLQGNPVFIRVDYETRLDSFEQTTSGARARQQIGDHVAVGATYVKDDKLSSEYELTGVDTEFRFGKNSRVVAEFAESKGTEAITFSSDDGGFTYVPIAPAGTQEGEAYKLAAELDVGEWFGKPDRLQMGAYVRQQDEGFSSDGTQADRGTEKSGVNFSYKVDEKNTLRARHDRQERLTGPAESTQTTLQWEYNAKRWNVRTEVQDKNTTDTAGLETESTTAAARADMRWTDKLLSFLEHQETLDGPKNDQTTIGVDYRLLDKLTLGAQLTTGTRGDSAQAGLSYELGDHRFYLNERLVNDSATGRSRATVVGAESAIGKSGTFYTEYQWARNGDDTDNLSLIGMRRRWDVGRGLDLLFLGERSEIDTDPEKTTRYALAVGLTFDNSKGFNISTRNEIRREEGGRDLQQFLTTNRAEYLLNPDLKVLGWYRYSLTKDSSLSNTETEFNELSVGLAYRPVANDRFNALFRYTKQSNEPTLFQSQSNDSFTRTDVLSADWSYQITRKLEWVGKQAIKFTEETTSGLPTVENDTLLTIQRFNYNFYRKFELGAEYRIRSQTLADDREQGWLIEFMWRPIKHLRLGVGYNFTDFSDDEFSENDFSVKGLFFRLQGAY
jgi:outer membrane protein OmpA-like peptidoglycan-associated protein